MRTFRPLDPIHHGHTQHQYIAVQEHERSPRLILRRRTDVVGSPRDLSKTIAPRSDPCVQDFAICGSARIVSPNRHTPSRCAGCSAAFAAGAVNVPPRSGARHRVEWSSSNLEAYSPPCVIKTQRPRHILLLACAQALRPHCVGCKHRYILPSGYTDNMTTPRLSIHDRLTDLADATRCRILLALESHELTVGELCSALQLPQSTVSRHLKILSDEAWLSSRADGASRWYNIAAKLDASRRLTLANLVREPLVIDTRCGSGPRRAYRQRARGTTRSIGSLLCRRRDQTGTAPGRPSSDNAPTCRRTARPARSPMDGRRPGMRHRHDHRRHRTTRPVRARRRRLAANACRRARTAHRRGQRDDSPPALWNHCRSKMLHWTSRSCCWSCTTSQNPPRALAEVRRVLKPTGRLLDCRHARAHARGIPATNGSRLAGLRRTRIDVMARAGRFYKSSFAMYRSPLNQMPQAPPLFAATAFVSPVSATVNGFVVSSSSGASPGRPAHVYFLRT